ncbi:MAG: hypothetical protein L6405_03560, partial [Actinomycetia bacterium]|nr:hypothetical protein [Actinomycetes bacterium]
MENNNSAKIKNESISLNSNDKNNKDDGMIRGRGFKFGDDISTDLIAPGRYFHLRSNMAELAKHVLEDADP